MAKIKFDGLEEYERKLSALGKAGHDIAGKAIYKGAGIIADEIRAGAESLPAKPDIEGLAAYRKKEPAPLTESAKRGLLDGLGITSMQEDNGYFYVKIGFDGYNRIKTKKYPKGQPNAMIARSLESGSSVSKKKPFIRPAVNRKKQEAEKAMAEVIDQEMKKLMEP